MLSFGPSTRISVPDALAHPWLAAYHDINDEPVCTEPFEKWRAIEELETIEQFQEALWNEIEDYRREVRGISIEVDYLGRTMVPKSGTNGRETEKKNETSTSTETLQGGANLSQPMTIPGAGKSDTKEQTGSLGLPSTSVEHARTGTATDPLIAYARRSTINGHSRQNSAFPSPVMHTHQQLPSYSEGPIALEPGTNFVAFPTRGRTDSYIIPARSRTASMAGGELPRNLLRTLSTVSIHESIDGLPGGLAGVAEIGKYIVGGKQTTGADAPASEMPRDFAIEEGEESE